MSNINFDRPILLLVLLLILAIVVISFVISINKENRTKNNTISFIIHIVIGIFITLALAKTTYEKVVTETNIYVLADVSYSSNKNLDLIDEYIEKLEKNAPKNSKIGVICFGKDYELLVAPGEKLRSVKESKVNVNETNIAGALNYAATLFEDNVIKRIVIISDGEQTNESDLVSIVETLTVDDIYVDAIYLDNNIKEDVKEVQINSVEYTSSTYLNKEESVHVYLQSNLDTRVIVSLYKNGELYKDKALRAQKGYNSVTFDLDTTISGDNSYEVKIEATDDESTFNNSYYFTQSVAEKLKVLFISDVKEDSNAVDNLYGDSAIITKYISKYEVPFTVEDLCEYDEFVLSNIDIRKCYNYSQLVSSLDTLVSEYGKSLVTIGNTYIQNNEEDEVLSVLSNMLPTKFGNDEKKKSVTLLIDISRSMEQLDRLNMAKKTACTILDNLEDDVRVSCIAFYGEVKPVFTNKEAVDRELLKEQINKLEAYQGTFLGAALGYAYKTVKEQTNTKNEVILISDGLPYREQANISRTWAVEMARANIVLSTIQTASTDGTSLMKELASIGRGYHHTVNDLKDVEGLVLNEVLNSLNETILENGESPVSIILSKNELVSGIDALPAIKGLYNNTAKSSADVVLETLYTDLANISYNIPLYTTWEYGNGKVSSFASTISGEWISLWNESNDATNVLKNIVSTNSPESRIDSAFIIDIDNPGTLAEIIVKAPTLNKNSVLSVSVTNPNGLVEEKPLVAVIDGSVQKYIAQIDTSVVGKYDVVVSYTLGELTYSTNYSFEVSYLPEYDSFTIYEASNLYYMVNLNGKVSEDGNLTLVNNNSKTQKYIIDFTPILMILSIVLFVIDVMVRKLRLQDIKSLFSKVKKEDNNI